MDAINFNYSLKNIPVGEQQMYLTKLMDMTSKFVERIKWRAFWYELHKNTEEIEDTTSMNNFTRVFPTKRSAPNSIHLQPFINDLFSIVKSVKFRDVHDNFQQQLKNDIKMINNCKDVLVFADKTTNVYKVKPDEYKKLIDKDVHKNYKKSNLEIEKQINNEAQDLINDNNIKGKIPKLDKKPAYVTIKDHKENFPRKVTCRLINPTKTHIGKVSKQILDNINNSIRRNTSLTQWKNTNEVINWFNQLKVSSYKKCTYT